MSKEPLKFEEWMIRTHPKQYEKLIQEYDWYVQTNALVKTIDEIASIFKKIGTDIGLNLSEAFQKLKK